jgi:hypothetical protein
MQIGEKTKAEILKTLAALLTENLADIDEAYAAVEAHLDLSFKIRLEPGKDTGVSITSDLSFVKGNKIKDKRFGFADEYQRSLFEEEA